MAAGDVTQGVRNDAAKPWDLKAGEYGLRFGDDGAIKTVWVRLPNGIGPAELSEWSPVVHEDGTLTLSPSILAHPGSARDDYEHPDAANGWHGFLERGVWREV